MDRAKHLILSDLNGQAEKAEWLSRKLDRPFVPFFRYQKINYLLQFGFKRSRLTKMNHDNLIKLYLGIYYGQKKKVA